MSDETPSGGADGRWEFFCAYADHPESVPGHEHFEYQPVMAPKNAAQGLYSTFGEILQAVDADTVLSLRIFNEDFPLYAQETYLKSDLRDESFLQQKLFDACQEMYDSHDLDMDDIPNPTTFTVVATCRKRPAKITSDGPLKKRQRRSGLTISLITKGENPETETDGGSKNTKDCFPLICKSQHPKNKSLVLWTEEGGRKRGPLESLVKMCLGRANWTGRNRITLHLNKGIWNHGDDIGQKKLVKLIEQVVPLNEGYEVIVVLGDLDLSNVVFFCACCGNDNSIDPDEHDHEAEKCDECMDVYPARFIRVQMTDGKGLPYFRPLTAFEWMDPALRYFMEENWEARVLPGGKIKAMK